MNNLHIMRLIALGSVAAVCFGMAGAEAAGLNTAGFIAACSSNIAVTDDPSFEEANVTPKAYCECVAEELGKAKASQADLDILTKMHKEELTDEDVENYPTFEELMNSNENVEDACRERLGLPTDLGPDYDEDMEEGMPEDEGFPAEDDGSPPE
jgi:hypothetical protein